MNKGICTFAHSPRELRVMNEQRAQSQTTEDIPKAVPYYDPVAKVNNTRSEKEIRSRDNDKANGNSMGSVQELKDIVLALQSKSNEHDKQIEKFHKQRAKIIRKHGLDVRQ